MYIPATMEIYMNEIEKLIDFDKLSPDFAVGLIWQNQTMSTLVTGS